MNYTEITSRNNEKIKSVARLVSSSRERKSTSLFVLEGARLCFDAAKSGYVIKEAYFTRDAVTKFSDYTNVIADCAKSVYLITDEVSEKISDTVNSQGIFCVVEMKRQAAFEIESTKKYIALENVQNPQNLGSVARSAEALGIDGIIVCGGCDMYNPKALRASMGSLLRIPIIAVDDLVGTLERANSDGMLTAATVPDENARDITKTDFSAGVIAVIGNEGNGVTEAVKSTARERITIKMKGEAESLNASVAAVITMWEIMR